MSNFLLRSPADGATPAEAPKRGTDMELQALVHGLIADAIEYTDGELSPDRAKATDYYLAKPFGNEEPGRSQVVLSEVRDATQGVLPQLIEVFFGVEQTLEFIPRHEGQVEQAAQATEFTRYVFEVDNDGFMRTHDVMLDGLIRKLGVFKWGWEPGKRKTYHYRKLSHTQLTLLAAEPDVEIDSVEQVGVVGQEVATQDKDQDDDDDASDPQAQPSFGEQPGEPLYDVDLTRTPSEGRVRIWSVPPDEFIYSREATTRENATFMGHRRELTREELIELGVPEKVLQEYGSRDLALQSNLEEQTRRMVASDLVAGVELDPPAGEGNDKILYIEGWFYVPTKNGRTELRRITTVGPTYHIVTNEPADERPFAFWSPSPEPHTITGQSWADRTMDIQLVKSSMLRATLDSAAASIFPRTGYVEGMVSVEDILNTEIGAPIRMRAQGMIQPIITPFLGQQMLPLMELMDDVTERRTGQNKGTVGLDADSLQSSTKAAVNAAVTAAQMQTKLLARLFAEQALKPLFRGILKTLIENQQRKRIVRLRNKYVAIDPRVWDAAMDLNVHVALGSTAKEEKVATLTMISEKMEQILANYGPSNPLVSVAQYRNVLARIIELEGYRDTHAFLKDVPLDWQPPAAQPQPSPEQIQAQTQLQVEQMKTQKDLQIKQMELQLKSQEMAMKERLELKKLADDFTLRRYQIDAQFKAGYTEQQLEADAQAQTDWLSATKMVHDAALQRQQQAHEQAMAQRQQAAAEQDQAHAQGLAEDAQAHDQQMAEQQAAQQGDDSGASEQ